MVTLSDQEKNQVSFVHGSSCDILSTTVARLYDGKSGYWEFTGAVGAVSVISDRVGKVNHIKIVDLRTTRCVFEQELYDGFDYQKPRDFFHTFEGDSQVFGLSFADISEAAEFYQQVLNCKSGVSRAAAANISTAKLQSQTSSQSLKKEEPKKKKSGFFGKFFGGGEEENMEISSPTSFQHKSHIGWDPEKGFDIRDIPADWRKLFQSAGIKKSDLKDAETAKQLVSIIGQHQASEGASKAPPPPPPSHGRSVPPPPPPSHQQPHPLPHVPSHHPPPPPPSHHPQTPPPPPPHVSTPPPPPPMNHTPPPPPPMNNNGPNSLARHDSSVGRGDLLASIREGKKLHHVDPDENPLPDVKDITNEGNLVATLANFMANRRANLGEDIVEEDDDDDDWSDY